MISFPVILLLSLHIFSSDSQKHYTNDWAIKINGGNEVANQFSSEMGYRNMGEIHGFNDTYLFRKMDHPRRSKRTADDLSSKLNLDSRVLWAEQQEVRERTKRDLSSISHHYKIPFRIERFNDELWPKQWYLHDTRTSNILPETHMHVTAVWDMGFTGKGVVITVIDDGVEWNHTDLIRNYDPKASWDSNDNDPDPFPRYDLIGSNRHGTRCAGEISMTADNVKCGVGVAYNSRIGGIRMLDGIVTDTTEAAAIAHNVEYLHIVSASWGPTDDGRTLDAPHTLTEEAMEKGIAKGRGGKGVIYIWASGNGGLIGDNCNCDGYTGSIYTLSIGSASQQGQFPWYAEKCASILSSAYSSGAYTDQKISTTHLHNTCTTDHSGTSAAAPLAAGIIALMLEANPNMTWRDVQHLTIWTAEVEPLKNNKGWKRNSAGLMYNSKFGFGLMNAAIMVTTALVWKTVPPKSTCKVKTLTTLPLFLSSGKAVEIFFRTDGCKFTENEINYLEHVQVPITIDYSIRGALDLCLTSPAGTESVILTRRIRDASQDGFKNWTFLTVQLWGEQPDGLWKLVVRDKTRNTYSGYVRQASIILHGTKEVPWHMAFGKREYSDSCLTVIDPLPEYDEEDPVISPLMQYLTAVLGKVQRRIYGTTGHL